MRRRAAVRSTGAAAHWVGRGAAMCAVWIGRRAQRSDPSGVRMRQFLPAQHAHVRALLVHDRQTLPAMLHHPAERLFHAPLCHHRWG